MRNFLFIAALVGLSSFPALAQERGGRDVVELPGVLAPEPPRQPDIPPVKFLQQKPAISLQERIDRLTHGIKVDVPPEYDIYGYELRRYMAHVAGPDVLNDPARIRDELKNIAKAKIILRYWQKDFVREAGEIEKALETEDAAPSQRTSFQYNRAVAAAFMAECLVWMEKNEDVLNFLLEHQGLYSFTWPDFNFDDKQDLREFGVRYDAMNRSRAVINRYMPFAGMVY